MSDDKKPDDPRTVQLKRVRLSFTDSLLEKKKTVQDDPNAKPKHSVNVILEQVGDDPKAKAAFAANKAKAIAGMTAACDQFFKKPEKWKEIMEDDPKRVCFRKGERFKNKDSGEVYMGYAGNMAIACGTPGGGQRRPKLYDRRKKAVVEKDILDVMYGGSYADVIISFFGTDKGGNGVFCTVEAIRSHEEGVRVAGGWQGDESAFEDMEDDDSFDGPAEAGVVDSDPFG
jgi:hypothetical protein